MGTCPCNSLLMRPCQNWKGKVEQRNSQVEVENIVIVTLETLVQYNFYCSCCFWSYFWLQMINVFTQLDFWEISFSITQTNLIPCPFSNCTCHDYCVACTNYTVLCKQLQNLISWGYLPNASIVRICVYRNDLKSSLVLLCVLLMWAGPLTGMLQNHYEKVSEQTSCAELYSRNLSHLCVLAYYTLYHSCWEETVSISSFHCFCLCKTP